MYPEIFAAITGETPQHTKATLSGWKRLALAERTYPGALPTSQDCDSILGLLWLHVPHSALSALDRFEGNEYERVRAQVTTEQGEKLPCDIYQWRFPALTRGTWNVGAFEREHRAQFFNLHRP